MNPDSMAEVLASSPKLKIADALSLRPRTLGELASITGISVQGVLRHLKRMGELGLVGDKKVTPKAPKARRVYFAKSAMVGDYSTRDLIIVKATELNASRPSGNAKIRDLESTAGGLLVQRRRVKDNAKRVGRMIEDLVADQQAMTSALEGMHLDDYESLILRVLLTEETLEDGIRVLSRYYGLEDRRSIDEALAKARRIVGK